MAKAKPSQSDQIKALIDELKASAKRTPGGGMSTREIAVSMGMDPNSDHAAKIVRGFLRQLFDAGKIVPVREVRTGLAGVYSQLAYRIK